MRYVFLKTEIFQEGEFAYVLDTEEGVVLKSEVRLVGQLGSGAIEKTKSPAPSVVTPLHGVKKDVVLSHSEEPIAKKVPADPAGELETPEQRKARLGTSKVPPAFLGDTRRMHLDPSLTDGRTDVTQNR